MQSQGDLFYLHQRCNFNNGYPVWSVVKMRRTKYTIRSIDSISYSIEPLSGVFDMLQYFETILPLVESLNLSS